jgi:aminoglycoside phosphotransferase (APT) family kinase protein
VSDRAPAGAALAAAHFLGGPADGLRPLGGGHIHQTLVATRGAHAIVLQRLNAHVFPDLAAIAHNVALVTRTLRTAAERTPGADRRRHLLVPVPGPDGALHHADAEGATWRAFGYVEGSHGVTVAERPSQAAEAARAFGRFFRDLADLDARGLREVLPGFHDTPRRVAALEAAIAADVAGRVASAHPEVAFARARHALAARLMGALHAGRLPLRVTHNDAKIANVLFDDATGAALCVVDLDTVMPGLAGWDVGDLVRSMAGDRAEDDPGPVALRWDVLEALLHGWIEAAGPALTAAERASLVDGALVITYEQGVRFLADHLEADRYYMAARPGHNLDRARAQFALLAALEAGEDRLRRIVESV